MLNILKESSLRIKTGLIMLGVVLLIGFIDSKFITWIFLGMIMLFAVGEAMKLFQSERNLIFIISALIWVFAYFYPNPQDLAFLVIVVFGSILAYTKTFDKLLFLPILYPLTSFLFIFSLYTYYGVGSLLWLLVIVAGTDIGAYFVGKSIGRTVFCETSPNKTLEGVIGGMITATVLGAIFAPTVYSLELVVFISALVSLSSVFGDLFESYLKREVGVKDSGDILPGHGGILDRTDGYLFGGVVMFVFLRLLV